MEVCSSYLTNEKKPMLSSSEERMFLAKGMGSLMFSYPNLPETGSLASMALYPQVLPTHLVLSQISALPRFQWTPQICSQFGYFIYGICKSLLPRSCGLNSCFRSPLRHIPPNPPLQRNTPLACSSDQHPAGFILYHHSALCFPFSQNLSCFVVVIYMTIVPTRQ